MHQLSSMKLYEPTIILVIRNDIQSLVYLLLLNALVVLLLIPVSQVRMTSPKGNPILQYALVQCYRSAFRNTTTIFLHIHLSICVCPWPTGLGFGLVNSMVGLLKQTHRNQTLNAMFGLVSIDMQADWIREYRSAKQRCGLMSCF